MSYHSSSILDPLFPQMNEPLHNANILIPDFVPNLTQLQVEGDHILPTFEPKIDFHYDILHQIPNFVEDPPQKTNHKAVQSKKRSLSSDPEINPFHVITHTSGSLCTKKSTDANIGEENVKSGNENEKKKKQKISHREVERQRRLEMSLLHSSLKTLLPLEYTKGKRSISDHLAETVKYINQMQRKMKVLIDRRDGLSKEVSTFKKQKQEHEVIVNVFKECFEIIVSTTCEDNDNGEQGLPLSKVIQCLIQEGLDVVNSISKRINDKFVHSIHAQIGDKDSNVIDAANLKQKLANVQR
nr:hypothetical protein [Suaeda aralocaspica]